jgi:uncharacterized membrane protein
MTAQRNRNNILLVVSALLYAAITCACALTRIYTYKSSMMDNGVINQTFWNVLHHGGLFFTVDPPYTPQHYLGLHFTPINLLLLPLYAAWPHIALFQIAQSVCFGLTGMLLFMAVKAAGGKDHEAWFCTLFYWVNPYVIAAILWDFHEIAFANVFIALTFWALFARRFTAFFLTLLLLLCVKEHYGLSVAGFGFLWGWRYGEWKRAIAIMILGIGALLVLIGFVIPAFHGGTHAMLMHSSNKILDRYGWMSDPWPEKIAFFRQSLLSPGICYLIMMLAAGFFFPLFAPVYFFPAAADLAANMLSSNPFQRYMTAYYSASIVLVMIIAGYQGYCHCRATLHFKETRLFCGIAIIAIIILSSSLAALQGWEIRHLHARADSVAIAAVRSALPKGGVSAQNNVGIFFSDRKAIYSFPNGLEKSNAAVLYLDNPFINPSANNLTIAFGGEGPTQYFIDIETLLSSKDWHVAYWQAPWLVMKRGAEPTGADAMRGDIAAHLAQLKANLVISP